MVLEAREDNLGYGGAGPLLLGVSWTECIISVTLVLLRLYGASQRAGRIRWDFFFVAVGTVFGLVTQVLFVFACLNGMGQHIGSLSFPQIWAALEYSWIGVLVGLAGSTIAKLGVIALYLQVTTPAQIKRRCFLWGIGVLICCVGIALTVIVITQCNPYDKLWFRLKPGTCDRSVFAARFGYFQGAVAALTDVILALYPISIVWTLQASFRVKLGFCLLMAGGILPAAAAVLRSYYIKRLEAPQDFTYEFVPFLSWACTELWFIIMLSSIPPLRPLFLRWIGRVRTLHTDSRVTSRITNHGYPLRSGVSRSEVKAMGGTQISAHATSSEEDILPGGSKSDQDIFVSREYRVSVGQNQGR